MSGGYEITSTISSVIVSDALSDIQLESHRKKKMSQLFSSDIKDTCWIGATVQRGDREKEEIRASP